MKRFAHGAILTMATLLLAWVWWSDSAWDSATDQVLSGLCMAGFMGVWWSAYLRADARRSG